MSEIPELDELLSKRVRVYLNHGGGVLAEGEVIGYYDHPSLCIRQDDGGQVTVSSTLRREVVDPLPPEPPMGAWARFLGDGIWKYVQRLADGWYRDGLHAYLPSSWEDIALLNPEVLAEQPQEKYEYERAVSVNGFGSWMHSCGRVTGLNLAPEPDPNRTSDPWRWCVDPRCRDEGRWMPLYVRRSSGE